MEDEDDFREKKLTLLSRVDILTKLSVHCNTNGYQRYYGYGNKFGTGLSLSHGGQKRSKNNLSPALPNHFSYLFF
jgi:hypothetical protein